MKTYYVLVREVWAQPVTVEADSPQEAIRKVQKGDGEYAKSAEYCHTLNPETWTVEEK